MDDDFNFELPPEVDTTALPEVRTQVPSNFELRQDESHDRGRTAALAGIDEEIVMKRRRPTVKLDADKLMSDKGLPLLITAAPKKLKFNGKRHALRDLRKLVEYYTLWAHGLYPRASFHDFLLITEKLGHSKIMRMARSEIIEGTKKREEDSELMYEPDGLMEHDSNRRDERLFFDDDEDDEAVNSYTGDKGSVHPVSFATESNEHVPKELQGLSDDDEDNGLFADFG